MSTPTLSEMSDSALAWLYDFRVRQRGTLVMNAEWNEASIANIKAEQRRRAERASE